ncbi:unnamed protein product [Eruca vesicaria subsp. sativa]|uniref:Uncharacterized protein n=1 Tax=Eruca vesicaria subsp. sativa TaxID=29727 RepID=A0ABC8J152_ERUVS|nr:unnamed protein product [Eruca vesicaria subsp. sativa]
MCIKFAELERSLRQSTSRHLSTLIQGQTQSSGTSGTSLSQTHFILLENMMERDKMVDLEEGKDELKKAGLAEDEMEALERQLMAAPVSTTVTVKDGVISQSGENEGKPVMGNGEDRVEIAQKEVPAAVFGGLVRKREEEDQ